MVSPNKLYKQEHIQFQFFVPPHFKVMEIAGALYSQFTLLYAIYLLSEHSYLFPFPLLAAVLANYC